MNAFHFSFLPIALTRTFSKMLNRVCESRQLCLATGLRGKNSFFFLLLRLDNFKYPIFKSADSFFSLHKSAVEPL